MQYLIDLPFSQWLGFLSFALGISTFYQKDDRKLKLVMLIFQFNNVLHFYLLGSDISAISTLLSFLRTATAIKTSSKLVAAAFVIVSIALGLWIADGPLDLLPILGSVLGTIAVFLLKGIQMRIAFIIGAICWLANNIIVGSIGGSLLEATLLTVNLFTIMRLYRNNQKVGLKAE
ncbi:MULTISPECIES: YgjV family protein [Vibrio]|uniref:YgjV family protein n=1 Tax=Vibrio casei TaxID=673372 RepID=A0A368LHZ1_9VIBR|nr:MULTISPECIES: YgjV family protein [Vibrio]RCS70337.1 YgjV family protein [Vibrio casei]SJN20025.1 Arginine/ornithine antiporter ArcD [Vibrio casei]HBV77121.1 YgjV family protein [Vibrio sp.]